MRRDGLVGLRVGRRSQGLACGLGAGRRDRPPAVGRSVRNRERSSPVALDAETACILRPTWAGEGWVRSRCGVPSTESDVVIADDAGGVPRPEITPADSPAAQCPRSPVAEPAAHPEAPQGKSAARPPRPDDGGPRASWAPQDRRQGRARLPLSQVHAHHATHVIASRPSPTAGSGTLNTGPRGCRSRLGWRPRPGVGSHTAYVRASQAGAFGRALGRIRTDTVRSLRPLSLPLEYEGELRRAQL